VSTPYYEDEAVTLYHGDAFDLLPSLHADAVITDPPYNVGKAYGAHDDRMEPDEYQAWLGRALALCAQASEDAVVFFPGTRNVLNVPAVLNGSGLTVHRLLGWHRKEFAGDKWNGGPAMCWEPVIWASPAEKPAFNRLFGTWGRDFLVVNATHGDIYAREHPCPKPVEVMRWLVGLFVPPAGVVLDPFAGTGATLRAAKDLGRRAIDIEREERFCDTAVRRLSQEVLRVG
jgi:site-specific DNA-methyltransferase (adenine-specific)